MRVVVDAQAPRLGFQGTLAMLVLLAHASIAAAALARPILSAPGPEAMAPVAATAPLAALDLPSPRDLGVYEVAVVDSASDDDSRDDDDERSGDDPCDLNDSGAATGGRLAHLRPATARALHSADTGRSIERPPQR